MPTIDPRKSDFHSDGTVTLGCNTCRVNLQVKSSVARNARLKHLGGKQTVTRVDVCPTLQADGFEAASKGEPQTKVCMCVRACCHRCSAGREGGDGRGV